MNFPNNIPTDNLYKFLAIAGIVVFTVSIYFPLKFSEELELRNMQNLTNQEALSLEWQQLEEKTERWRKELDNLISRIQKLETQDKLNESNRPYLREELISMLNQKKDLFEQKDGYKIRELKHNKEISNFDYMTKKIKRYRIIGFLGIIFGFSMSSAGFFLWYIKLQKYLDKEMRKA